MARQLKQKVITIHGINSDGQWQTEIRRALEPHFECHEIRYGGYGNLGLLALILDPRLLLALLVVTYVLAWPGVLRGPLLLILPSAFVIAAYVVAYFQRRTLLERFEEDLAAIGESRGYLGSPHVIAHCFGTYLTSWALRSASLRFDHVILAGAVLPADYNWGPLFQGSQRAFRRLRNEVGRRDWVLWLTRLCIPFWPSLEWAGWQGFRARPGPEPVPVPVHDADDSYGTCQSCNWPTEPSIHNVRLNQVTRSDRFIQFGHAQTFWRPFLWNIDPREYQEFLDLCSMAARMEQLNWRDPQLRRLVQDLGETHWNFLGRTLNEEISQRVPGVTPDRVAYGLCLIWSCVSRALEEQARSPVNSRDEQILLALKPQIAIQKAVTVLSS